jgi:hypothetical protein
MSVSSEVRSAPQTRCIASIDSLRNVITVALLISTTQDILNGQDGSTALQPDAVRIVNLWASSSETAQRFIAASAETVEPLQSRELRDDRVDSLRDFDSFWIAKDK